MTKSKPVKKRPEPTNSENQGSSLGSENRSYLILKFSGERLKRYAVCRDPSEMMDKLNAPVDKSITSLFTELDETLGEKVARSNSNFAKFIDQFSETIKSFYHLVEVTSFINSDIKPNYINNRLIDFAQTELKEIDSPESFSAFSIEAGKHSSVLRRAREVGEFTEGMAQLPSLLLMGLVARYDAQVSSLVRLLLKDRPETIGSRESEFDLASILKFSDIDDLKNFFIDKEVEKLMYSSHHDQLLFIEKNFHVKIVDKVEGYSKYLEIFERRNLVAHGEGKVNGIYDVKCSANSIKEPDRLPLGSPILLPPSYLFSAIDSVFKLGLITIWSLWMKRHKEEIELGYDVMLEITFDLMLEKRFDLVSDILNFALNTHPSNADEVNLRIFCINKAICDKRKGSDVWRKSLEKFQWGACTANFRICIAAIDEDIDAVCHLMKVAASESLPQEYRLTSSAFREWPAFHWVRSNAQFRECFREVFSEDFDPINDKPSEEADGEEEDRRVVH